MAARQSPLPLFLARIAFFKALFTTFVIFLATRFESFALLLAQVLFMVGILSDVTPLSAGVAAILQTDITRFRAFGFGWILPAVDFSCVIAERQHDRFLDTAHCSRRIDVAFKHCFMAAFVFALHSGETFTAGLPAALLTDVTIYTEDFLALFCAFEIVSLLTAVHLGKMLTVIQNLIHFHSTVNILRRPETFDFLL